MVAHERQGGVPAGKQVNPSELAAELAKQEICNNTKESVRSGQRRQYPRKLTCRAAARLSAMCHTRTSIVINRGEVSARARSTLPIRLSKEVVRKDPLALESPCD
jgi:hypothetical protein